MLQPRRRRAAVLVLGVAIGLSGLGPYALAHRPNDHDHEPVDSEENFSIDVGDVDIELGGLLNNVNVGNGNAVGIGAVMGPLVGVAITGPVTATVGAITAPVTAAVVATTGAITAPVTPTVNAMTGAVMSNVTTSLAPVINPVLNLAVTGGTLTGIGQVIASIML